MKKQELAEVSYCDICGKRGAIYHCMGCEKDYCYECQRIHTRRFRYLWVCSNEVNFCNDCLASPAAKYSPLIVGLRSMEALRAETDAFYETQNKRGKALEVEMERLIALAGGEK